MKTAFTYSKDTNLADQIEIQRAKLQKGNPYLSLSGACRIGNGITALSADEAKRYEAAFDAQKKSLSTAFFVPASGSGSRMFDALYQFLQQENPDEQTIEFVEHLVSCAADFAFYEVLPQQIKDQLLNSTINLKNFIRLLLSPETVDGYPGLNYGNLPKGLIPFHRYEHSITNPFQEHILQGIEIAGSSAAFHFTINEHFKAAIDQSIRELKAQKKLETVYDFSIQNPETDAIAFDVNFQPVSNDKNGFITRPAGHGALLENLNSIHADLIFIRNIDNIQHQRQSTHSTVYRKALGGVLIQLRNAIFSILSDLKNGAVPAEKIQQLNTDFDLKIPADKLSDTTYLFDFFNRPVRVCGMVKNEGQPGGGPFWVSDSSGQLKRQIVEKSQITNSPEQLDMLIKSTHFNPVELVCSTKNFEGNLFDLHLFRNDDQYFIVHKTHQGKPIQYIEEPGLWNGSMDHWLTLFYEIESDCFSPVKTVLDLLKPLHREK